MYLEFTDRQMRTWHVMEREGGSICIYYTKPANAGHFVVWDSLDANPSGLTSASTRPGDLAAVEDAPTNSGTQETPGR